MIGRTTKPSTPRRYGDRPRRGAPTVDEFGFGAFIVDCCAKAPEKFYSSQQWSKRKYRVENRTETNEVRGTAEYYDALGRQQRE